MDQNFLRVDDRDYLLLHIEPCGPRRLRLIAAEPKGRAKPVNAAAPVVVETKNLKIWFPIRKGVNQNQYGFSTGLLLACKAQQNSDSGT